MNQFVIIREPFVVIRVPLILVLMENGLGLYQHRARNAEGLRVLILVLMEYGLGHLKFRGITPSARVLILVLVEYGLEPCGTNANRLLDTSGI